jgi:hypothetical protein
MAMKNLLCAALVLSALPAASLPLATPAAAQMLRRPQPVTGSNELLYSYRHHYRAYGATSPNDVALPPDEIYFEPCYKWVDTRRGARRVFVCRS